MLSFSCELLRIATPIEPIHFFQRHVLTFAEREEAEAENGIISRRGDAFRERAGPLFRGGATRRSLGGSERVAEDQDADEIRFMAFGRL